MGLESILITILGLALIGFILYLVINHIPMPETYKQALVVFIIILIVIFLIRFLASFFPNLRL